jgi:hypothetical protein
MLHHIVFWNKKEGANMKSIIMPSLYHIRLWKRNFRALAAFMLGIGLSLLNITKYLSFARAIDSPVQIFEAYTLLGSVVPFYIGTLLGSLLLLSDAPFVSPLTKYEMLRIGRRKWFLSQVVYIAISCVIYSIVIFAFSIILSVTHARVALSDNWSSAMVMLAEKQPEFAAKNFKIAFGFPDFIHSVMPSIALLMTMLFNTMYMILMSLLLLAVNLITKRNIGWIAAILVHILGYIAYANGGYVLPLKYSLLSCAAPAYHFIDTLNMSSQYSFTLFVVMIAALIYVCMRFSKSVEPINEADI